MDAKSVIKQVKEEKNESVLLAVLKKSRYHK